jgi:curved DNA-binding protein CbpA
MPETIPDFDLYAALGVHADADDEAIRAAHREAVRLAHPDVAGDDDEQAKRLNVARDWLSDPERRARYDAARAAAAERGMPVGPATDLASPSSEAGVAEGLGRREALGCLELAWWLLLLAFAGLILAVVLLIAADL